MPEHKLNPWTGFLLRKQGHAERVWALPALTPPPNLNLKISVLWTCFTCFTIQPTVVHYNFEKVIGNWGFCTWH